MNYNQSVITSMGIVKGIDFIAQVFHENDGDWQFLGIKEISEKDVAIVSIKNILEIDTSINKVLSIPKGYFAYRNQINDEWKIEKNE